MNYRFLSSRTFRVGGSDIGARAAILSLIVCQFLFAGCRPDETIHTYKAPKPKTSAMPVMGGMRGSGGGIPVPTRMLGAILSQADETWFFKLTAPPDEAADLREEFGAFVASTRFENGQPTWEIPDGWTEERGGEFRYTTYHIGDNGPEVSISKLLTPPDETDFAVLNINRWRGQLNLPAIQSDEYLQALGSDNDAAEVLPEEEGEIVSISTPSGKAVLIDFVGEMATGGGPPFANMAGARPTEPREGPPPGPVEQAGSQAPKLNPPDHWKPGKLNQFRVAAFVIEDGNRTAEVTLSTAGGDLLANVNRWRGMVDLPGWTEKELAENRQSLKGKGYTADYVKLIGPKQTILGAVIDRGGRQWFVKLSGPNELAEQETQNFEEFVKSIEF